MKAPLKAEMVAPALMATLAGAKDVVTFVEVGANDGVLLDPLRPSIESRNWRGVLVEPIPHIFSRLEANYRDNPRVQLEQAAIADAEGTRPMYFVREGTRVDGLSPWHEAIASFDRDHVRRELGDVADPDSLIDVIDVPCMTLNQLCTKHGIEEPDLILIDVEGADAEVVETIDLRTLRPRLLIFEHVNLSEEDRASAERRLVEGGYVLVEDGLDVWAMDLVPDDELSERWRAVLGRLVVGRDGVSRMPS